MEPNFLHLSWSHYYNLTNKLAGIVLQQPQKPELIVGISRCGLTLGHLLSDQLQLPIATIAAKSYVGIEKRTSVEITEMLGVEIKSKHILLADGISDTGNTFIETIKYLKKFNPLKISTAAIFMKPHTVFKPDYYVEETNRWILFPYERTEWIITFTKEKLKEKKSTKDIQEFLLHLGYSKSNIVLVFNRYFPNLME